MVKSGPAVPTRFGVTAVAPPASTSAAPSAARGGRRRRSIGGVLSEEKRSTELTPPCGKVDSGGLVILAQEVLLRAARLGSLDEGDPHPLDPVALDLEHVEAHPVVGDVVSGLRRAAELAEDETGQGVEVLLRQIRAEALVEVV